MSNPFSCLWYKNLRQGKSRILWRCSSAGLVTHTLLQVVNHISFWVVVPHMIPTLGNCSRCAFALPVFVPQSTFAQTSTVSFGAVLAGARTPSSLAVVLWRMGFPSTGSLSPQLGRKASTMKAICCKVAWGCSASINQHQPSHVMLSSSSPC